MSTDEFERRLAETDWSRVSHAYGKADDVPDLLRALASGDASERMSAFRALCGNILHQGTRYPATVKAIPCLIELLRRPQQPDRCNILVLQNALAVGDHQSYLITGFDFSDRATRKAWGRNAFGRSYVAVREGIDVYFHLLQDQESDVRGAAAFLIGFMREAAERAVPVLRTCIANEPIALVKGSMLIAAGMLAMVGNISVDLALFDQCIKTRGQSLDAKVTRTCAAIGLAYVTPSKVNDNAIEALQAASTDAELAKTASPWNDGDLSSLAGMMIGKIGKYSDGDMLRALVTALQSARDGHAGLQAAHSLIDHLFQRRVSPRLLPSEINDRQADGLRAIHASDAAWHYGNIRELMLNYGLPESRELLGLFLGFEEIPVASQILRVERDGIRQDQPAWICDQMLVDGLLSETDLARAIAEQLPIVDAIATCVGPIDDMLESWTRSRGRQRVHLSVAVFDRLGKNAEAALIQCAEQIVESDCWMKEARLSISVALTRITAGSGLEVPSVVDSLIQKALPASQSMAEELDYQLAIEVLSVLPEHRRVSLLMSGRFPKWKLYPLVPPHTIFDHAMARVNWSTAEATNYARWAASQDLQVVINGLYKGQVEHREILATILGESQTRQSVETLFGLLEDTSKKVRRAAVASLSGMPKSILSDGIAKSLQSRHKHCREAAKELL